MHIPFNVARLQRSVTIGLVLGALVFTAIVCAFAN